MRKINRRKLLQSASIGLGSAGIVTFSGCVGDGGNGAGNGNGGDGGEETVYSGPLLVVEDALDMVPVQLGVEEGIWSDYGLDLEVEVGAYGRWSQAVTTGSSDLGGANQAMMVDAYDQGYELAAFGSCLIQTNDIFVHPESDIESPADLEGASLGVPQWESGTTLAMRATIEDEWGIDLQADTDATVADPPALWELMVEQEELDAMIQFTGFTIRGYANPDLVRPIYDVNEYWEDRTGHPLEVTYFVAPREWIENNYDVAHRLVRAWDECVERLADDPRSAYDRLGLLAGLDAEDEIDIAAERFEAGGVHNEDAAVWDEDYVDAQWEFLELLEETGVVDTAPPRDWGVTHDELEDNAS